VTQFVNILQVGFSVEALAFPEGDFMVNIPVANANAETANTTDTASVTSNTASARLRWRPVVIGLSYPFLYAARHLTHP
jgi:hypothetical protein